MTTLLVSPDFASHYTSLGVLGAEAARRGQRVVVATGPALRERVLSDGFEHVELVLGRGSNGGLSRLEDQPEDERRELRAFYAATREGMTATLAHQVRGRETDMLWQPDRVARRLERIIADLRPRRIIVDHLAFGATLALRALGRSFASLLPSHPCQLPRPGDPDGFPVRFPDELAPSTSELTGLRELCERQARRFTAAYNAALLAIDPAAIPVRDAVSTPAPELTVVAYPAELAPDFARPGVTLVGSLVRDEAADHDLAAALRRRRPGRPAAYVSLGTFLSARKDVLATIAAALRRLDADAVISTGVTDASALGPIPPSWHVRSQLPQVAAIAGCDVVVCHGGNNTVMEALTAGVPVLAGPFSSDQFVAAEDLRRGGVGDAFAPNQAGEAELAARITGLVEGPARDRAAALGQRLRERPGAARAWELIEGAPLPGRHPLNPDRRAVARITQSGLHSPPSTTPTPPTRTT
jgi:UDP:flavonoid glycosyltransferase YjiC (YdhE family)